MAKDEEEDPLSWAGGTDLTHADATVVKSKTKPSKAPDAASTLPAAATGSALLVSFGILAGAYLLYTVGWVLWTLRDPFAPASVLDGLMYQLRHYLTIAAPLTWYAVTLLLTRHRPPVVRLLWLLVGAAVLIPWPFIVGGAS